MAFLFICSGRKSAQSTNNFQPSTSHHGNLKRKCFSNERPDETSAKKVTSTENIFSGLKYGTFVVYLHGDRNCLRLSAQRSNMQYTEKEDALDNGRKQVEIKLNDQIVASACEENLKASKTEVFRKALLILQKECYTIKVNLNNFNF